MRRALAVAVVLMLLYAAWLGMLLLHEAGHVLHAMVSGGSVVGLDFPLLGFSQTHVEPNPRPLFVAWGGPSWGSLLPLAGWGLLRATGMRGRRIAQFFAGFCLVANGAYIGVGWSLETGDAADLRRMGTPVWVMIAFGLAVTAGGLWLWHRLGPLRPARAGDVEAG